MADRLAYPREDLNLAPGAERVRLIPSDPDVQTIVSRLEDGSLDLRPDFQRGSVWPRSKQRLLVDSILRDWYIPPVHVVRIDDESQIVLDGQQRLQAIWDFVRGKFSVDGSAEPASDEIQALGKCKYESLPPAIRRRFDRFTIRLFEVIDYSTEEPYELFFRLNQTTPLTSAEKRNAFFGPARAQVGELTSFAESCGMIQERIGFSNARLAYEDVIARFVWTIECGTLDEKVTASGITERYREPQDFDADVVELTRSSLSLFLSSPALDSAGLRLNRAMLHTWLCFTARSILYSGPHIPDFLIQEVEFGRSGARRGAHQAYTDSSGTRDLSLLYRLLNDRATSRVSDVSSVLLRDAILWACQLVLTGNGPSQAQVFADHLLMARNETQAEASLLSSIEDLQWARFR